MFDRKFSPKKNAGPAVQQVRYECESPGDVDVFGPWVDRCPGHLGYWGKGRLVSRIYSSEKTGAKNEQ